MQLESIAFLPFIALIIIAMVIWVVAAYSFFNLLRHARGGKWHRLIFQFGWWNKDKVDQYIDPPGMSHYHRLTRAIFYFLVIVICAIAYAVLQLMLQ